CCPFGIVNHGVAVLCAVMAETVFLVRPFATKIAAGHHLVSSPQPLSEGQGARIVATDKIITHLPTSSRWSKASTWPSSWSHKKHVSSFTSSSGWSHTWYLAFTAAPTS